MSESVVVLLPGDGVGAEVLAEADEKDAYLAHGGDAADAEAGESGSSGSSGAALPHTVLPRTMRHCKAFAKRELVYTLPGLRYQQPDPRQEHAHP